MKQQVRVTIGWMNDGDIPAILDLDRTLSSSPLTTGFVESLTGSHSQVYGVVARSDRGLVGYVLFRGHKRHLEIKTLLVAPLFRRRGIGRALLEHLKRLDAIRAFPTFMIEVRDTDLGVQKFLSSVGFRAVRVKPGSFTEPEADGYIFVWERPHAPTVTHQSPEGPRGRDPAPGGGPPD